jgi:hypothetical protein
MGGATDGILYKGSVCRIDDNRNVPELWFNDDWRKLDLNWWNNDWNENYRFLSVRNYIFILT